MWKKIIPKEEQREDDFSMNYSVFNTSIVLNCFKIS